MIKFLETFFLATTKRVYPTRPPQIVGNKVSKKENKTSVAKSLPGRPADVNKWGREGEKFRPGMANNPSNPAVQLQSDNMQGMLRNYRFNPKFRSKYYQKCIDILLFTI